MKTIPMPNSPKRFERQYADFTVFMIEQMAQRFKNQVLLALNKSTVEKFSDAQVGNYSTVYLTLANRVRRKLLKQFSNPRIKKQTDDTLSKVNEYNQQRTYAPVESSLGLNTTALIAKEGLKPQVNALMLETANWSKKLRDDTLEHFTANTLRSMALGKPLSEIIDEFDTEVSKRKNHARFIARNQVANFNGLTTKIRHQKLGITEGIWVTSKDERVRKCHKVRNGKRFKLSQGLYSSCDRKQLFPGTDYQCRCTYRAIVPEAEEVGL
jgi:SPP1 gp7 family putative phage head morphogenesis protein